MQSNPLVRLVWIVAAFVLLGMAVWKVTHREAIADASIDSVQKTP